MFKPISRTDKMYANTRISSLAVSYFSRLCQRM